MEMIRYKKLKKSDINRSLFHDFIRTQQVTKCWRRENGIWVIKDIAFVDDWRDVEYEQLIRCLQNTADTGGLVMGAFMGQRLVGFASVEKKPFGSCSQYMDLSSIHVSQDMRGHGVGKLLFYMAEDFARGNGAEKLYISAHSAVETQAFYRGMGCKEAEEYNPEHVEKEPCDCQLECDVSNGCTDRSTSQELINMILGKLPVSYKKAVFYYEASLNQQTVGLLVQTESGELYMDNDLVKAFSLMASDYEDWIDRLHDICSNIRSLYYLLKGEAWYQMYISLTPDAEPEFCFSMEDWCDVSGRLKRMLLSKREFGAIMRNDENLLRAYEDFMLHHKDAISVEHGWNAERSWRDLLECFIPHSFTNQMIETAKQWMWELYKQYEVSCTEKQMEDLARLFLYAFEQNEEALTEDFFRRIRRTECIGWLKDLPTKKPYEYYYVPENFSE